MKTEMNFDTELTRITSFIESLPARSFSGSILFTWLQKNWKALDLSENQNPKELMGLLFKSGLLKRTVFSDEKGGVKEIFAWNTEDSFTICSGLKNGGYYTHYTAMFLHGLTLQIPKSYYLNFERASSKILVKGTLRQDSINKAFSKEQRKTTRYYSIPGTRINILNGKHTNRLGVIQERNGDKNYAYTDLERTLIDISIRPAYSGGIFEVLDAYEKMKGRVAPDKLHHYLSQLDYLYPYHQTIGFYLDKAGYGEEVLEWFDKHKEFDFYLTYNMRSPEYSSRWKLFYPRGFD